MPPGAGRAHHPPAVLLTIMRVGSRSGRAQRSPMAACREGDGGVQRHRHDGGGDTIERQRGKRVPAQRQQGDGGGENRQDLGRAVSAAGSCIRSSRAKPARRKLAAVLGAMRLCSARMANCCRNIHSSRWGPRPVARETSTRPPHDDARGGQESCHQSGLR